ncbi:uncharacterized protein LACBIDRAFT_333297 [Laccaria bicolor S238N-H82]|uniref:Predicted protein n=1 Tax=Laccaria bicolor (strain S238N-H82 / ATCC MYA-4686) TaxID=486041 RepID=B0DVH9_LACBS|nr:uncharacterized protein LACBIDRAFT_333297 [Laccaria bicolor S238N-H82]EDR01420.1 predicted protein [Laccaria bicolor S238N-H82]|eukprot:XP_001887965.1 predicted protein [Laccaria bicolor S238N-H82]
MTSFQIFFAHEGELILEMETQLQKHGLSWLRTIVFVLWWRTFVYNIADTEDQAGRNRFMSSVTDSIRCVGNKARCVGIKAPADDEKLSPAPDEKLSPAHNKISSAHATVLDTLRLNFDDDKHPSATSLTRKAKKQIPVPALGPSWRQRRGAGEALHLNHA